MKVILRTDVEKLGKLGDLVTVRAGYGRNYLLPQGFAMLASPSNLKVFELERRKLEEKTNALRSAASDMASKISNAKVSIAMRVGDNEKLYGSVTTAMIAEAMAANGLDIDRRRILLDSPLRMLGSHPVRIRLHADVTATLNLAIVAERSMHADQQVVENANQESAQAESAE